MAHAYVDTGQRDARGRRFLMVYWADERAQWLNRPAPDFIGPMDCWRAQGTFASPRPCYLCVERKTDAAAIAFVRTQANATD